MSRIITAVFLMTSMAGTLLAQEFKANYDESAVPDYSLPDPLIFENGIQVKNINDWQTRRAEILALFEDHVYGISPSWKGEIIPEVLSSNSDALSGNAKVQEIKLTLKNGMKQHSMNILLFLPKSVRKAPVFLGYNFNGNHTVTNEPTVVPADIWNEDGSIILPGDASERGSSSRRWPIEEIIARGYGVATIYYGDVDPDFDDGFKNGVHGLFDSKPGESSWGSIAAWSWGLSRAMDFLETVPEVNSAKVIVIGHSRLGKAALWAGASDNRFAMVISNNSGCGGAALSKRVFGETVGRINRAFPHWFCEKFNQYNEKEEILPVDQHELLALIAPRPLYVASASEDQWADPKGEFIACRAASPVYVLLGKVGLPVTEMPEVGKPVSGSIGYHIREGKHDILLYDWLHYLDFADKHL
jgi:hypothetical protein